MSKSPVTAEPARRVRRLSGAVFGLATLHAVPAGAGTMEQPPAAPVPVAAVSVMTLDHALAYAEGHQPELRAARERFLAAEADARVASAEWLPSVGAMAALVGATTNNSTATVLGTSDVDLPRIGGTVVADSPSLRPYATTLVAVGLRQQVFDFGRIAAQEAAADGLVAIERERLQVSHLDVAVAVTQAYYAVRAARAVALAAAQAEQRASVHRDYAEVAVNAGLRPPIERTRAAADLAKFSVGRIRAEGNIRIARSVFAAATGYPEPELDVSMQEDPVTTTPSLAEVEKRTLENLPEIHIARNRQQAQHKKTLAITATTRPSIYASAAVSGRAGGAVASSGVLPAGNGFAPVVPNYDVALVLSWPLYEPTVNAAAGASQQREWALTAELTSMQQRARTVAQQAYRRTRVAESALGALAQVVESARQNYDQAEARFRSGLGTSTELADAEAIRLDAEVQQAVGRFEFATARAQLTRAMGG